MANHIKELRKSRGITQAGMAESLGVALSTVQNWESERTVMTGHSLMMVADFFGVTPNEVYGSGEPEQARLDERELIGFFRACTPAAQAQVLEYAELMASAHPKNQEVLTA